MCSRRRPGRSFASRRSPKRTKLHEIETIWGPRSFARRQGEALHPDREPLETLERIRRTIGEYNFAGQYQQSPAPLGGGLVKEGWFRRYSEQNRPERFDRIVQSWDTANKATELSDFSVCTTWGVKGKDLFLLDVVPPAARIPGAQARGARAAEPVRGQRRADRGQGLGHPADPGADRPRAAMP